MIITVKSLARSDPDKAPAIAVQGIDRDMGEAVVRGKMLECYVTGADMLYEDTDKKRETCHVTEHGISVDIHILQT